MIDNAVFTVSDERLPNEWQLKNIPALVGKDGVFVDGDWVESKDQDPDGEVRLIQLADVGDGEYRNRSQRFLTFEKAKKLGCTFLQRGDILIARMPDPLGRACIFPGDKKVCVTVVDVAIVRPGNDKFNAKWLMYFINAPVFRKAVASMEAGSTRKRISRKNLSKIYLPVPPIQQQKKIVSEIEKQFSRLDEAVAALKRIQANLKRYKASVLKAAIEGKLTEESRKSLRDAIVSLDQGWSPRCEQQASEDYLLWGVIKTTAVQPFHYLEVENKKLPDKLTPRPSLEIIKGDLLVTRAGPRSRVGVVCLVRSTRPRLMICDKVYRMRCNSKVVLPKYIELVLNAPQIMNELDNLKSGISDSGVNLTQERFLNMNIPLPPIKVQETIIEGVERQLSVAEEIETVIETNLIRAERLRQSILKKAFEGKLV